MTVTECKKQLRELINEMSDALDRMAPEQRESFKKHLYEFTKRNGA